LPSHPGHTGERAGYTFSPVQQTFSGARFFMAAPSFDWCVWFVLFIWLNETTQINQINQINKTNQITAFD
jgi:hypothetical protein